MTWLRVFGSTFVLIFLAEMGDKTQLAIVSAASRDRSLTNLSAVFGGAAGAMVVATLLAVAVGGVAARLVPSHVIRYVAGGLFILFGLVIILGKW